MSRLRVHCLAVSLDGYVAGPDQSLEHPLGRGGLQLHQWAFATRTFQRLHANGGDEGSGEGGATGIDDDFIARGFENIGAWIVGRNMFGPIRGPWPDLSWQGWWGANPPYHCPVFVLTHHPRPALTMEGGTVFHFVGEGIESALALARAAAGGKDVRLGGGAATVRQYLRAGLVDEMHLALVPSVLLGSGEPLFEGLDLPALGYRCSETAATAGVVHLVMRKT